MPRHSLAGVLANRALRRVLPDDPEAWWVTCFAVDQRHRHRGIATSLLGRPSPMRAATEQLPSKATPLTPTPSVPQR